MQTACSTRGGLLGYRRVSRDGRGSGPWRPQQAEDRRLLPASLAGVRGCPEPLTARFQGKGCSSVRHLPRFLPAVRGREEGLSAEPARGPPHVPTRVREAGRDQCARCHGGGGGRHVGQGDSSLAPTARTPGRPGGAPRDPQPVYSAGMHLGEGSKGDRPRAPPSWTVGHPSASGMRGSPKPG